MTSVETKSNWYRLCYADDLVPQSGVCALLERAGQEGQQIAVFYLPEEREQLFALGNYDPVGKAFVLSRGIVGDLQGHLVVASPLYKQHFDLRTGRCLEDQSISVPVYQVRLVDDRVEICA